MLHPLGSEVLPLNLCWPSWVACEQYKDVKVTLLDFQHKVWKVTQPPLESHKKIFALGKYSLWRLWSWKECHLRVSGHIPAELPAPRHVHEPPCIPSSAGDQFDDFSPRYLTATSWETPKQNCQPEHFPNFNKSWAKEKKQKKKEKQLPFPTHALGTHKPPPPVRTPELGTSHHIYIPAVNRTTNIES